jgi:hypothetical protein
MNSMLLPAAIAAVLLGAALLFFNITGLLALLRETDVAILPVVPEQEVRFTDAGSYVLEIEQPRLSRAMRGAHFRLLDAKADEEVPSRPIVFRGTRAGLSSARLSERTFHVPHSGSYRLQIGGLAPAADVSAVQVVFTQPNTPVLVLRILGIVGGGVCLIGGVVFMSLRLGGKL